MLDGDTGGEKQAMRWSLTVGRVVDVDAVDADERGTVVDKPGSTGTGEEVASCVWPEPAEVPWSSACLPSLIGSVGVFLPSAWTELMRRGHRRDMDDDTGLRSQPVGTGNDVPRFDSGGFSLDVEPEEPDDKIKEVDDEIKKPFDPEKIDVRTRTMTVDLLLARLRRKALDLAPEFQRRAGIWKPKNQSRLIESLLLRIPLPSFYAAEYETEEWAVVDGVQRLSTIASFIDPGIIDAKPLKLQDLEYLPYNGKAFDDLPGRLQTRLVETEILIHLIGKTTPEEVKFNIFGRINTGGVPLSRQELRHALIPGPARELLPRLAVTPEFQRATLGSVRDERMSDCEMVLRFLAFRIFQVSRYTSSDLDLFLRDTMQEINKLNENSIRALEIEFREAMIAARDIFGEHAFRKRSHGQVYRKPINKALFESIAVNLAERSPAETRKLVDRREQVTDKLADLLAQKDFNDAVSIGTGDRTKVAKRFAAISELFSEVVHA